MKEKDGTSLVDVCEALQLLPLQLTCMIEEYKNAMADEEKKFENLKSASRDKKRTDEEALSNSVAGKKEVLQSEKQAQINERSFIETRLETIIQDMNHANNQYLLFGNLLEHKNAKGKLYTSVLEIMKEHDQLLDRYDFLRRELEAQMPAIVNEAYFAEENARIDREYNAKQADIKVNYLLETKADYEQYTKKVINIKKKSFESDRKAETGTDSGRL